jgi:hypothetical protein
VPETFPDKLVLGTSFVFANYLIHRFVGPFPERENRSIDLHARLGVNGTKWYSCMRQFCFQKAQRRTADLTVALDGIVRRNTFFKELYDSKLCFSPFGYGEVCWRDFEAMFAGSLLLKQDMSHLHCTPDVYIPFETYVPLAWDLSDFDEKVDYYLAHPEERDRIARNAYQLVQNYFLNQGFLQEVRPLFEKLGIA